MSLETILNLSLDAPFTLHGESATYTPAGGSPVTVTVIPRHPDEIIGLTDTPIQTATMLFDIRVSELADPDDGDVIAYKIVNYLVSGEPRREDDRGKIWTIETRPQ